MRSLMAFSMWTSPTRYGFHELAYGTNTTVSEVIDVVDGLVVLEITEVLDHEANVLAVSVVSRVAHHTEQ